MNFCFVNFGDLCNGPMWGLVDARQQLLQPEDRGVQEQDVPTSWTKQSRGHPGYNHHHHRDRQYLPENSKEEVEIDLAMQGECFESMEKCAGNSLRKDDDIFDIDHQQKLISKKRLVFNS